MRNLQKRKKMFSQSVQSLGCVRLFATPWSAACQAALSVTISRSLPKFLSIESVMPSSHLILCRPLLLMPPIPPSIRVFSNESTLCMRWPKYWSFSFSIIPSKEIPGLISFRMDWLDLLAVQGTLKSPLQHHSSKASILWCCVHVHPKLPNYPFPLATISSFSKSVSLFLFWKFIYIISLALSFLHSPARTSIHDHSENHSLH